jgi:outer membrane protein insertion porin family
MRRTAAYLILLWWLPLLASLALGQAAYDQSGRGLYEGQAVSAVVLVANPHLDVDHLKDQIPLKPGNKFTDLAVQTSVSTLKAGGQFSDVKVMVTPEAEGLQVEFVLEPAYYVGIVDFPGASKNFSYTRLMQVTNLPEQDPFDKNQVPQSEDALVKFLHSYGYFKAQVHAETLLDDRNELANIVFHVELGKRAAIGEVKIEGELGGDGNVDAEQERLLKSVQSLRARFSNALLKPGKTYTPGRISRAKTLIKNSLTKQQRLASLVKENPPVYHADTNRADVSFHVEIGPEVDIRITGAKLSSLSFLNTRRRKTLIPIYSEATVDRDLVTEGQNNLIDFFQTKGYFDAKVQTDFQRQPGKILLTYEVDKGKKHKVGDVKFTGNRHLDEDALMDQLTIKRSHVWTHGRISQKLVQASVKNLQARYRDEGFEQAKITPEVVDHEPRVDVTFKIDEGPQTIVNDVQVQGNASIPESQLSPVHHLETQAGAPYSPSRVFNDRSRIAATYLDRGFLNSEVKAAVNRDPGDAQRVNVVYNVTERQEVRVKEVLYLGLKQTRASLVQRTANLRVESPMSQGSLLKAESDLYDLGIFDWSSVGPAKPIASQTEETAVVKVHEAKRNEITYGFGFEISHRGATVPGGTVALPGLPTIGIGNNQVAPSQSTYASPRGSIEFTRRNLRGEAETGAVSLLLSRLDQRFLSTYSDPHFIGSKWGSVASFSLERTTENPLYAATLGDLSFQVERQISKKTNTRLQLRYDFNKTYLTELLVPELVLPQDRNVRLSTLSTTLIRDTRDVPLDAHRGTYSTVDLGITPEALGSSATFGRMFSQFAYYKPVGRLVFANSIRLGFAKAFAGSFVPTSELFFSGGGTSLRGFPINTAGPQRIVPFCDVLTGNTGCVNVSVPVGGRQLFIFNSELRFPLGIMKNLGGVVFYDGGNVYSAINFRNFIDNYTNTVGFGFRYSTPVGPVRIDIGRNLNPVPGISATQYFITLGQAF